MSAHPFISKSRLEYCDQLLLSCGWTKKDNDSWIPPIHLQEVLSIRFGGPKGTSWHRKQAISLQVQYDEAVVSIDNQDHDD
jgi:hypothetical protein